MRASVFFVGLVCTLSVSLANAAGAGKEKKEARKPNSNEACLSKGALNDARSITAMELESSLKRSKDLYIAKLNKRWSSVSLETDPKKWKVVPYESYYYQDVTGIDAQGEEAYAREDECSYLVVIEAETLYSNGFTTLPYIVHLKLQRDISSGSKDKSWKVAPESPQRAVIRVYPNNNPRG